MNDEQQLTFQLGITSVPSDATCDDNALEECIGMVYDDGEHRVIQRPAEQSGYNLATGETLLYIHAFNNVTRLIIRTSTDVVWRLKGSQPSSNVTIAAHNNQKVLVESIGNTLIVSTSSGLRYLLWDYTNNTYKNLGNKIPDIRLNFTIDAPTEIEYPEKYISLEGMLDGIEFVPSPVGACGFAIKNGQYENFKNAMIGLLTSRLNNIKEKGRFAFPFWVRYAIRMYDGQHINISNPFLIMPTVNNNWWIFMSKEDGTEFDTHTGDWSDANYKPLSSKLYYTINTGGVNLNNWTDIINGVDIFVSDEVKNFDMGGQWEVLNTADTNSPVCTTPVTMADSCQPSYTTKKTSPVFNPNDQSTWRTYFRPTLRSDQDIINSLISSSSFYKIIELDMDDLAQSGTVDASSKIAGNVLKNLVNQTQLEYDDYFSRTNIVPQVMKTYNHRLHMANVTRDFFDGFTRFSYTQYSGGGGSQTMSFYVHIKSDSGERIVKAESSQVPEIEDVWFYYPDPRAYKVEIFKNGSGVRSISLKEHPYLNGAYCFKHLPGPNDTPGTEVLSDLTPNKSPELLEDQLLVSEVDNPYIFTSRGYVNVGMGVITALAAQTMSLGENEHGIHPLLVFTEKGISMLRVTNEGTYSRSDESSREVADPSNPCVIETDGPVFFASKKGLMVAIGSGYGLQVKCVSEQLNGKSDSPFAKFLTDAVIAYDYRDSLLWIMKEDEVYAWIYAIKSGTFSRYQLLEEEPEEEVQAAPVLQAAPVMRSANRAASSYIGWPVRPFTNIDANGGSNQGTVITPIGLVFADNYNAFALKGYNGSAIVYQFNNWEFEGHQDTDYNDSTTSRPRTDTIFYNRDNSHYYAWDDDGRDLVDLGTEDPTVSGGDYINVSQDSLSIDAAGGTLTFDVTSDIDWNISNSNAWITSINPDTHTNSGSEDITRVSVTVSANSDTSRSGSITVFNQTLGVSKSVSISQSAAVQPGTVDKLAVVNNYPDNLIQIEDKVYSLLERDNINDDEDTYAASLVTRAMKFGNGMALKNVMRMRHVMQLNGQNGTLSVRILAKNDLNDVWHELTHLRGTPWKYYQFRYTFGNLLATDRFGGTLLITQTRRTNKLR